MKILYVLLSSVLLMCSSCQKDESRITTVAFPQLVSAVALVKPTDTVSSAMFRVTFKITAFYGRVYFQDSLSSQDELFSIESLDPSDTFTITSKSFTVTNGGEHQGNVWVIQPDQTAVLDLIVMMRTQNRGKYRFRMRKFKYSGDRNDGVYESTTWFDTGYTIDYLSL